MTNLEPSPTSLVMAVSVTDEARAAALDLLESRYGRPPQDDLDRARALLAGTAYPPTAPAHRVAS